MPTTRQQPSALALTTATIITLAVILFITHGIGGVLVVGVVGLLAASYLAHRYMNTHLGGRYPRHGDHMD